MVERCEIAPESRKIGVLIKVMNLAPISNFLGDVADTSILSPTDPIFVLFCLWESQCT